MVKKTIVRAYSQDGQLVDEFEYSHPITKKVKYHLSIFLSLHYSLHPKGYVQTTNYNTKTKPLKLTPVCNSLF